MEYHEYLLSKPLSDFVQTMWAMQSEHDEDIYPKSQVMPDGIVEVIFHYENPFYTYPEGEKFLQPDCFAINLTSGNRSSKGGKYKVTYSVTYYSKH